ncbi:hypothetical protein B0T18DRAFT_323191 [Schizothecium vesticola]|uniref:C3H1-type domain-containing protein n=1 Tax=Schizothecium vesticola TaxID=314040 RepID=A0AA40F3N3_9PEZI|nr:hypothetical protein B0T18DRAFT_323191 [Schizothecium vesticola]
MLTRALLPSLADTSHVPCKFYRQGACQAGNACPFSHDLGIAAETVCKYFAKGNCKFGPKCANIHMLPDGRRINYGKNGNLTIAPSPVALGARVNLTTYLPPSNSALTNSFLRADAVPHFPSQDDRYNHQLSHQPSLENTVPTIDTTQSSNPASAYGSPRDDDTLNRFNLGLSPNAKGLSVLDAPLPASFDSNGISHAARYGPWPSSVPSKFGLESPSSSLNAAKDARTSETLKLLHDSAFGSPGYQPPSTLGAGGMGGFGSSPPVGSAPYAGLGGDEFLGRKAMHSSSFRYSKPRAMSSSVPKVDRDWDVEFLFEEDYVPGALANEVLTAAEKARRGSTNTVRGFDGMEPTTESVPTGATKFGSPMAASPSRWGSFFQRQREEEALESGSLGHVGSGRSIKASAFGHVGSPSAFGHVGSPLRNSSLASAITSELDGELSNGQSSRTGPEAMSALTQQIQRTRLGDDSSTGTNAHLSPHLPRNPGANGAGAGRLERHVSTGSIGSSGRFTTPIDEEDSSFVFSMEEEPEEDADTKARKRTSGGPLKTSSSGWSYASAVASNRNGAGAPGGSGSSRNGGGAVEAVGGGK